MVIIDGKEYFTSKEVAEKLNRSTKWVLNTVKKRKLKIRKVNYNGVSQYLFEDKEIQRLSTFLVRMKAVSSSEGYYTVTDIQSIIPDVSRIKIVTWARKNKVTKYKLENSCASVFTFTEEEMHKVVNHFEALSRKIRIISEEEYENTVGSVEVAKLASVSKITVSAWAKENKLQKVKRLDRNNKLLFTPASYRLTKNQVQTFLEERSFVSVLSIKDRLPIGYKLASKIVRANKDKFTTVTIKFIGKNNWLSIKSDEVDKFIKELTDKICANEIEVKSFRYKKEMGGVLLHRCPNCLSFLSSEFYRINAGGKGVGGDCCFCRSKEHKRQIKELNDTYIDALLYNQFKIPRNEVPEELRTLKRSQVKVHRKRKEINNLLKDAQEQ